MKAFIQVAFSVFALFALSGCAVEHISTFHLQGNRKLIQSHCVFQLDGVRAQYLRSGNLAWHFDDASTMNALLITFKDNEGQVAVVSIDGSYKALTNNAQVLKLAYLDKTNALLALNTDFRNRLEYGKYKINLQYELNGKTNTCNFDVSYILKTEIQPVFTLPYLILPNYGDGP
jgi:hypothetical protein